MSLDIFIAMTISNLETVWKEVIVGCFKGTFQHVSGRTEDRSETSVRIFGIRTEI
jgi:hypothetical protein